jgi:drug/metabolite transporter (DMT)-like permease
MASPTSAVRRVAIAYSVLAAFLWATYYLFVLLLDGRISPVGLLADPFLFGGVAYTIWVLRQGDVGVMLRLFASPLQWVRILLFLLNQVAILSLTLIGGAVDASLLSLVGDAALTPLCVMLIFSEGRDRLRSPLFIGGLLLSSSGAVLTIIGGGTVVPLNGIYLLFAAVIPVAIAGFFVSAARAGRTIPVSAVAGNAALGAGLLALLGIVLVPSAAIIVLPRSALDLTLIATAGVLTFCVAPALYFSAIARTGIILPALLMAGIPVFTVGIETALNGHLPPPLALLGVPVAIVGAILAIEGTRETAPVAPPIP